MIIKALQYPETRRVASTTTAGGITVDDPYQWLEADTPEVQAWQTQHPGLRIAVNLSARQFRQRNLIGMIEQSGAHEELPAQRRQGQTNHQRRSCQ